IKTTSESQRDIQCHPPLTNARAAQPAPQSRRPSQTLAALPVADRPPRPHKPEEWPTAANPSHFHPDNRALPLPGTQPAHPVSTHLMNVMGCHDLPATRPEPLRATPASQHNPTIRASATAITSPPRTKSRATNCAA